ncbi:MAG: DNA polymerase [Sulfurimonas sp.]|uniref:DNA polymerase n=1 Tax=Sulfurimonas sp. TaxID=2022749 RepID=UPI003D0A93BD
MVKFKIITSLNEISHLTPEHPLFSDCETEKLYVNMRLLQVYQPMVDDTVYILDTDILDEQDIKNWLLDKWTIWHNCSYDLGTLNMVPAGIDDTLYLCKNAFPEWQIYGLDKVVDYLGFGYLYEGLDKKEKQKDGFMKGVYLSNKQLRYAAADVVALSKIWEHPLVQKCREITAYKVDMLNVRYAIQYQQNGIDVHTPSVKKELQKCYFDIKTNIELLNGLNPNSPKQCKQALGVDSTNEKMLVRLISEGNIVAKTVYDQRRLIKRKAMLESYNYSKVYTRFNVAGAVTGRFTSTGGDIPMGINSQQIPRSLQYMFIPEDPEYVIVKCDYPTLELRLGCTIFNEYVMYERLMAGEDLHIATARDISGNIDISKKERQDAKAVNFGFLFGMGAESFIEYAFLKYNVIFTLEQAKKIRAKYFQIYPGFAAYHRNVWNKVKQGNYIYTTPLGRRVKPRTGTDGINGPVQGGGSEVTKLSVHYMCKEEPKILTMLNNVVHDANYAKVHISEAEEVGHFMVRNMAKAWAEISKTKTFHFKDIPMPLEYEILTIGEKHARL